MAYRTALFGGALLLMWQTHLAWWAVLLFLGVSWWGYQTQAIVKTVKSSFVITVLGSILIIGALLGNDGGWGRSSVIILLIALYYLLLGLSNLIFVRKRLIYGIAHTGIIYAGLVVIQEAIMGSTKGIWVGDFAVWLFIMLMIRESMEFENISPKQSLIFGGVGAFITAEIAWMLNFFPLTSIQWGGILALFVVALERALKASAEGRLNLREGLKQALIFTFIALVILATATWEI
ncbi:hypothetical protein A3A21_04280 [Candidatus Jorgensenbacteria bacterium RIFCSPLOWO2_01_FULL_45_25b]|uniref:Uncharacterized protein n=2 Tax=Parcubacteria group TaxID=1794811 RepID=A0A1F6BWY2_9BACT|nr:MAG: hypothetical protein A3A21_04280 [Candidatus Jorgensenbacteria bacterium RIFCSPLOWO2_01_FULL_45_25b]OHA66370.1 MAG: hypothetical protein A2672_00740 [Candidatus Wildermuthbacteria bacterium RIFCSPHIGHO2_01_FULL_49_22b]